MRINLNSNPEHTSWYFQIEIYYQWPSSSLGGEDTGKAISLHTCMKWCPISYGHIFTPSNPHFIAKRCLFFGGCLKSCVRVKGEDMGLGLPLIHPLAFLRKGTEWLKEMAAFDKSFHTVLIHQTVFLSVKPLISPIFSYSPQCHTPSYGHLLTNTVESQRSGSAAGISL